MAIGSRSYARPYASGGAFAKGIGACSIVNTALFLAGFFLRGSLAGVLSYLALTACALWSILLRITTTLRYQFLHFGVLQTSYVQHARAPWMRARELEEIWGTQRFLRFYFLCGSGAGVCVVAAGYLFGAADAAVVGSSARSTEFSRRRRRCGRSARFCLTYFPMAKMRFSRAAHRSRDFPAFLLAACSLYRAADRTCCSAVACNTKYLTGKRNQPPIRWRRCRRPIASGSFSARSGNFRFIFA